MKTKNKVISILMCLCLTLLSACSGGKDPDNTSQTTVTTTENLDNEVDYSGMADEVDEIDESNIVGTGPKYDPKKTAGHVHALCYYDLNETSKPIVEMLAQRFGGTFDTEITSSGTAYFDKLGQLIATGNSPDIVRYEWTSYPYGMSKNMYTPLDEWLDMDSELWVNEKEVIESYNYAGKHYYYPSGIEPNFVIVYNEANIIEAGLDSPIELYKNNNWTWDTFKELNKKWVDKSEEHIGFTGGSWTSMMFANTAGVKVIDITGTEIINNFRNPDVERAMAFLSDMKKTGLVGEGYVNPAEAFIDGNLLFLVMGRWGYTSAQESFFNKGLMDENKIVELPLPKDPQADKYYTPGTSYGFVVPAGAPNVQGAVSWILCDRIYETDPDILAENYAKNIDTTPVYYDKCPGCKYDFPGNGDNDLSVCPECDTQRKRKWKATWDEEQMQIVYDMKDPSKFTYMFDGCLGMGTDMENILIGGESSLFDGPVYYSSSYTQILESQEQAIEAIIQPYRDDLAKALAE